MGHSIPSKLASFPAYPPACFTTVIVIELLNSSILLSRVKTLTSHIPFAWGLSLIPNTTQKNIQQHVRKDNLYRRGPRLRLSGCR